MRVRLSLASALLACLALGNAAAVAASDRGVVITIGHPSVEIHAPPVSIHFGPQPIYRPYYYYPPRHYHYRHAPIYYYEPRHHPHHRHPHRHHYRDYHYRDHRQRR